MTAPTTRETADHAELARLAEDALPLESHRFEWGDAGRPLAKFYQVASPDRVKNLLSEIATLRGEVDGWRSWARDWEALAVYGGDRATQAERQRDELRKALDRQCDNMSFALNRLDFYSWHGKFEREVAEDRALLTNQGADQ